MKSLNARIDTVFANLTNEQSRWAEMFVEQLHGAHLQAEHAMYSSMVRLLVGWFLVYAIGVGLVTEGEIAAIKVAKLQHLLIIAPPLMGFFGYTLANAAFTALTSREALGACYRNLLPSIYENDLETLIATPTFIGAEQSLGLSDATPAEKRFLDIVYAMIGVVLVFGPLAAILHSAWLLWQSNGWETVPVLISTIVGLLIWIRSLLVINRSLNL